jgi:hypothetical protein
MKRNLNQFRQGDVYFAKVEGEVDLFYLQESKTRQW